MATKGLTNIVVTKTWRDGRAYFETYVDALRNAIGNVSSITNLNLVQLAKDISPSYSYTNNGTASLTKSLQEQINDIQAGGVPITGTTSNSFSIRSASNYLKFNASTLTTPVTLTAPDESGEIVLDTAEQTLTNKTLENPLILRPQNWTTAVQVGNDLAIATVETPALAAMNGTDVAFIDSTNDDLRMYRFNGTDWAQVGNDLPIATVGSFLALAAMNGTDVAFIDSTNDDLRMYRFNGTDWAQVGNDLNITGVTTSVALAAMNGTDVAFIDNGNDDLRIYRFNGTDWAQVGNDLAIATVGSTALAAMNGTDVAFFDLGNDDLRMYRFNGTDWAQVGNDLNITGVTTSVALAAMNGTDVAFIDNGNDDLRIYRFNGTDWAQVGNDLAIATVGSTALAAMNGTDVAFIDSTNDDLRMYRFIYEKEDGPYSAAGGSF